MKRRLSTYRRRQVVALAALIFLVSLGVVLRAALRTAPQIQRPTVR